MENIFSNLPIHFYWYVSLTCSEELPAEESGRVEEEGFRGTRLLMGLPSLVESFTAHAVQSGVVPPSSSFNNGRDSTMTDQREDKVDKEDASTVPMETEPSLLSKAVKHRRVIGSTSGGNSADSQPSVVDAPEPGQGSDQSLVEDVTSADLVNEVKMGIMEEGKISKGRS